MKTKRKYSSPEIELIVLDNVISLALASIPPDGPFETNNFPNDTEAITNVTFKTSLG